MNSLHVKKGDNVIVLAGKDKGKKGTVLVASPKAGMVKVEGVNTVTKHMKPRGPQKPGGMQTEPGNIHVSNVQVVCPDCGKPTRVAHAIVNGKKARICKHCGASLDKETKAAVKREKKTAKRVKKTDVPETEVVDETTETPSEEKPVVKTARRASKKTETPETEVVDETTETPSEEKPVVKTARRTAKKTETSDKE